MEPSNQNPSQAKIMNRLIENFINGNLSTAKVQAKRHSRQAIQSALESEYGYSAHKALVTALYLKGQAKFQEACDAA